MNSKRAILLVALVCLAQVLFAQGRSRGNAVVTIKSKKISINYGRPNLNGRDLFVLAPVGMVWRMGMDNATEISSDADLQVAGQELKAGKYSLWVRRIGENNWTLAFHPKTGIWGAPALREGYVAEMPLKLEKTTSSADLLTIELAERGDQAAISIHWGASALTGSFGVK